jgi:hypothetical protein
MEWLMNSISCEYHGLNDPRQDIVPKEAFNGWVV